MTYKEVYNGLTKEADMKKKATLDLARLIKQAKMQKKAAGVGTTLQLFNKGTRFIPKTTKALSTTAKDFSKIKDITPGAFQKAWWKAQDAGKKALQLGKKYGPGAALMGGAYGVGRSHGGQGKEELKSALKEKADALATANNRVTELSNYKEQVGTGFWDGLWKLLQRLFSGKGYAPQS